MKISSLLNSPHRMGMTIDMVKCHRLVTDDDR